MIIDLMIIFPVLTLSLLGFRDGAVKKTVALIVTLIALILAQVFLDDVSAFYVDEFDVERSTASLLGYFTVFFGLILIQGLAYRLATDNYKMGGIVDRVIGSILGLMQGVIVMSVVFMMLRLEGFPSRQYRIDSRLYKPVVNIAPQLLDFTLEVVPETTEELKGKAEERLDLFTKPDSVSKPATGQPAQKRK